MSVFEMILLCTHRQFWLIAALSDNFRYWESNEGPIYESVRSIDNTNTFKKKLKTFLFTEFYDIDFI